MRPSAKRVSVLDFLAQQGLPRDGRLGLMKLTCHGCELLLRSSSEWEELTRRTHHVFGDFTGSSVVAPFYSFAEFEELWATQRDVWPSDTGLAVRPPRCFDEFPNAALTAPEASARRRFLGSACIQKYEQETTAQSAAAAAHGDSDVFPLAGIACTRDLCAVTESAESARSSCFST